MQKGRLRFASIGDFLTNNAQIKFYCSLPVRTEYQAIRFLELIAMNKFGSVNSVLSLFGAGNLHYLKESFKETVFIRPEIIGDVTTFEIEDFDADTRNYSFRSDGTQSSNYRDRFGKGLSLTRETIRVARFIRNGGRILVPLLSDGYIGQNENLGLVFGLSGGQWKLITYGALKNTFYEDKLHFADHSVDEIISGTRKIPFGSFKATIPTDISYILKTEARFSLPIIGIEDGGSVVAPIVMPPINEEEPEEIEVKLLVDFYITNMDGDRITNILVGEKIYLNIETQNMVGDTMDLFLNNKEVDFKYNGTKLENDILKNHTISSDYEKVLLEAIKPD